MTTTKAQMAFNEAMDSLRSQECFSWTDLQELVLLIEKEQRTLIEEGKPWWEEVELRSEVDNEN